MKVKSKVAISEIATKPLCKLDNGTMGREAQNERVAIIGKAIWKKPPTR